MELITLHQKLLVKDRQKRPWATSDTESAIGIDYGKRFVASFMMLLQQQFASGTNHGINISALSCRFPSALIVGEQSHFAVPQNDCSLGNSYTGGNWLKGFTN